MVEEKLRLEPVQEMRDQELPLPCNKTPPRVLLHLDRYSEEKKKNRNQKLARFIIKREKNHDTDPFMCVQCAI